MNTIRSGKNKIIGVKADNNTTSKIKSVKNLVKKYIMHVDNVDPGSSCDDIVSLLKDNNIDAISCFTAKSWIHFREDEQTWKAFRPVT